MTSDGTITYEWDAENRLIKINYPGMGNASNYVFDGLNQMVEILEISNGSITSQSQLIWYDSSIAERRENSTSIRKAYFRHGIDDNGAPLFNTLDHLNSVRETSSQLGTLQAFCAFTPFGEMADSAGQTLNTFQFAGYYKLDRSNTYLTRFRVYSPALARWLSRDPLMEDADTNLYSYVKNCPTAFHDPLGLQGDNVMLPGDKFAIGPVKTLSMIMTLGPVAFRLWSRMFKYNRCIDKAWRDYNECCDKVPSKMPLTASQADYDKEYDCCVMKRTKDFYDCWTRMRYLPVAL